MTVRVPIATIPGLASAWVGFSRVVIPASTAYKVVGAFLGRNGNQAGDVVVASLDTPSVQSTLTLSDGSATVYDSGLSFDVAANEALSLAVTSADANSENLYGWVDIFGQPEVQPTLTSLARVKEFEKIVGTTHDNLIEDLILSVSAKLQNMLGASFVQVQETVSVDSIGLTTLALRKRPIISVANVTELGSALVEGTDFEILESDKQSGVLRRISSVTWPMCWARGERAVRMDLTYGYTAVPADVQDVATQLVAWTFKQSAPGGDRLGKETRALDTGGSTSFVTGGDMWKATLRELAHYRQRPA